jgi:hypothetical protein
LKRAHLSLEIRSISAEVSRLALVLVLANDQQGDPMTRRMEGEMVTGSLETRQQL